MIPTAVTSPSTARGSVTARSPSRARIRARHIGMLFQSANLIEHLTVTGNLALARSFSRPPGRHTADLLRILDIHARADAYPSELSGGELARAGLAVALANDPTVLLADEPTGELDSVTEALILDLLLATADRGTAVIVASHSPAVAAVASTSRTPRRRTDVLMIVAECSGVSRTFGSGRTAVLAVAGVDCQVTSTARIAVTGSSGSGKSTFLHLLAGVDTPTAGTVRWPESARSAARSTRRYRHRLSGPEPPTRVRRRRERRTSHALGGTGRGHCG